MESQMHIDLVNRLVEYVKKLVPENEYGMIQSDSAGNNSSVRVIGNFVPDVYYCVKGNLIIGEAKTHDDFERKHSQEQFDSYVKECMVFGDNSTIVVAIPWQLMATAKNYFKRMKKKKNLTCEIVVINELGKEMHV